MMNGLRSNKLQTFLK